MKKTIILGIAGSLRVNSSSHLVLKVIQSFMPEEVEFRMYNGLAHLPPFDDSVNQPLPVEYLKRQLKEANGVFFVSPEYAYGVPGILKNAIDWTVASGELVNKPTAIVVAATGGEYAYQSLLLTFKAISSNISEDSKLLISFVRSKLNELGEIKDNETEERLKRVITDLIRNIQASSAMNK